MAVGVDDLKGLGMWSGFPLPPLAGTYSGECVVVGMAPGYMDEVKSVPSVPVIGVNDFVLLHPGVADHWVTVHPEAYFTEKSDIAMTHSDKNYNANWFVDCCWPIATRGGSSAFLAVMIALCLGFERVAVAGVQLTGEYAMCRDVWVRHRSFLTGKVFSLCPRGTFVHNLLGGYDG